MRSGRHPTTSPGRTRYTGWWWRSWQREGRMGLLSAPLAKHSRACLVAQAAQGTAGGFAVQFGASKDSQTAADTKALSGAPPRPRWHVHCLLSVFL